MVECGHQVRLTQTALTDHDHGAALVGADGLNALQQVMRGIGNFEKLFGSNLSGTSLLIVR